MVSGYWLDGRSYCGNDAGGECWERDVAVELPSQGGGWTSWWAVAWLVGCQRDAGWSDGLPLFGEVVVVGLDWSWSTVVDLSIGVVDETVIVDLLNPLVDNAS